MSKFNEETLYSIPDGETAISCFEFSGNLVITTDKASHLMIEENGILRPLLCLSITNKEQQ